MMWHPSTINESSPSAGKADLGPAAPTAIALLSCLAAWVPDSRYIIRQAMKKLRKNLIKMLILIFRYIMALSVWETADGRILCTGILPLQAVRHLPTHMLISKRRMLWKKQSFIWRSLLRSVDRLRQDWNVQKALLKLFPKLPAWSRRRNHNRGCRRETPLRLQASPEGVPIIEYMAAGWIPKLL